MQGGREDEKNVRQVFESDADTGSEPGTVPYYGGKGTGGYQRVQIGRAHV